MSEHTGKRLVLIDGHGLAYRMFYAIQAGMSTRAGEPTNATYGFTRQVLSLITSDDPPDYLAVSFDVGKTFRDEMFDDYKATREKMPDDLSLQIGRIQQVLDALNVPHIEIEGYEADDVLGTVARLAGEMGVETLIITGDKDLLQLVNEHTLVQLPGRKSGEDEVYDIDAVREKMGIAPAQIVDYKALVGDKSDNIPGVAGIGDKSAVSLLNEYGSVQAIYENLDAISSTRARNALIGQEENADLSYRLAKIVTDVPLEFDLEACHTQDFDVDQVAEIFQELEFRSFLRQIRGTDVEAASPAPGQQLSLFGGMMGIDAPAASNESVTETHIIRDEAALDALVKRLNGVREIAFDTETTSTDQMQARLVGISLAVEPGEAYYIPVGHSLSDEVQLPLDLVIKKLTPPMTNPDIVKIGHNIKYDAVVLERHGLSVTPLSVDTMIGEWLLHPEARLGLKALAFSLLGVEMTEISDLIGKGARQITFDLVPVEQGAAYAAADADMTLRLSEPIRAEIEEQEIGKLFYEIEMPLVGVLSAMEQAGVLVDVGFLENLSAELGEQLGDRVRQVYEIVGYDFNLNSTQQLSDALFKNLQLPTQGLRKTKSGHYSTAADVLEGLRDQDTTGVIEAILDYREMEKLRSTYLDALPQLVNPETGRIHTSFNQTGTVTGRISSSDPNLQNIPIRSEVGRRVREAFVAASGHMLIGADYSQVELRVMAHMADDPALRQAFLDDQDIHATTAATVFNIPLNEVTPNQRSFAKAVNFGLMYGMGAFRLARDSELTLSESEAFIKTYFERFPKVREYLDGTRRQAAECGYVETLLGRRRYFPILSSTDTSQRANIERRAAEREAVNMPIQGTAADIIKIAMIRLHDALRDRGLSGQMLIQVHDELILEAPEDEIEETAALVKNVMENAYPLSVPLKVDAHVGENWGELK
ncbi:MAG: DNA polymerase I [Anaerolineae bacterium]|nr:DNA polymerase I [Anaerolineae bacterium]